MSLLSDDYPIVLNCMSQHTNKCKCEACEIEKEDFVGRFGKYCEEWDEDPVQSIELETINN